MKASWERGCPARTKPGTASVVSPTWINRERRHGSPSAWPLLFPPTGWLPAASHSSSAAAKGTGCGRDARAPRGCRPGGAVGSVWRATSQKADVHLWGNSRLPASRAPALPCGSFEEKRLIVHEDEPRMHTNRHEDRWTFFNDKRHQNASAILCPWCDDVMGKASRERGRPARTKPGTASAISPTWINRERRHGSPTVWPLLFPATVGLPAASRETQRRPKGQDVGRLTPALPGGAFPAVRHPARPA